MKLNWGPWVYGLFAGFIGGGASAISAGIASSITDPADANVHKLFYLMGVTFLVSGAISSFAYLAKSPLPSPVQVEVKEKTTETTDTGGTKVVETKMTGTMPPPEKTL